MIDDKSFEGMCPTCRQHYHRKVVRNPKKPVLNLVLDELDKIDAAGKSSTRATLNLHAFERLAVELGYPEGQAPDRIQVAHPSGVVTISPE